MPVFSSPLKVKDHSNTCQLLLRQLYNFKDPAVKRFYNNVALIQDTEKEKSQVNSGCPQSINPVRQKTFDF